jgi:hypothetical protein
MSRAAADGEAKARTARLREIKAELAATLGYTPEQIVGAVKDRLNVAATLRLQHELVTARLLAGYQIGTDELLRLSDSVGSVLPKPAPQGLVIRFVGGDEDRSRIDGMSDERLEALTSLLGKIDGKAPLSSETVSAVVSELQAENAKLRSEVEPLRAEVADLQKQVSQLRASVGAPLIERAAPPADVSHGELLPPAPSAAPRRGLPKPEFSDAYEMLASANAGLGLPPCPAAPRSNVYLEFDALDEFGRRIKQT